MCPSARQVLLARSRPGRASGSAGIGTVLDDTSGLLPLPSNRRPLKTPPRSTPGKLGTGSRCEARSTVHGPPGSPALPRRFHAPLRQVSSGQELAASPQPFCPGSPATDTAAVSSPGLCRRRREGRARALGVSTARARVQHRGDARSPPTAAAHLGPPGGGLEGNGSGRQRRRQTGFIQGQTGAEIQTPAAQQQMQQRAR